MSRLPLHYQILIALVIGTVVGLFLNPGDVAIEREIEVTLKPVDDGISLIEADLKGRVLVEETIPDEKTLKNRFSKLHKLFVAKSPRAEIRLKVSDPRAHIVEDGNSVTLSYLRHHDDSSAVTRFKADNAAAFTKEFPQWTATYEKHGGGTARQIAVFAKAIGDLFLRLLKMITIPLIVTSLVTGVAGLGNASRLGSMFGKTLAYYMITSVLAITTGLAMVNLIRPGIGANLPGGGETVAGEDQSLAKVFGGLIDNLIPTNPIESLAGGDFLSIISFSILVGVFIILVGGESGETLRKLFKAAFDVMMRMTMAIIKLAPIGVLAFMIFATATQGVEIFKTLAWYMLAVFLALLVHACVVLPLILKFIAKRSPVQFAQAMSPALMTAFSTASSNATLPLTMTSVENRAGVSNKVSSFVLPLGATVNMDGTALYEAVAVLFIAQAYNGDMPLASQLLVAITALAASVGAAGIPHAGLVMMAIVLQAAKLPLEAQGIIIAVDRVLDMCRTTVNVWSDSCGCAVLDRLEGNGEAAEVDPDAAS
jgi:Na+/H+-dicarboxylate symporter